MSTLQRFAVILKRMEKAIETFVRAQGGYAGKGFSRVAYRLSRLVKKKSSPKSISVAMLVVSQKPQLKVNVRRLRAQTVSTKTIANNIVEYYSKWKKSSSNISTTRKGCMGAEYWVKKALKEAQKLAVVMGKPLIQVFEKGVKFNWGKAFSSRISKKTFPLKSFIDAVFEDVAQVMGMEIPDDVMLRGYRSLGRITNIDYFFLHGITIEKAKIKQITKNYIKIQPLANKLPRVLQYLDESAAAKCAYFPKERKQLIRYQKQLFLNAKKTVSEKGVDNIFRKLLKNNAAIAITGDVFNSPFALFPSLKNKYIAYHRSKYKQNTSSFTIRFQPMRKQPRLFISLQQMVSISFYVKKLKIEELTKECRNAFYIRKTLDKLEKIIFY